MAKVVLITLLAVAAEALKVTNVEEPAPASNPCECLQWYDVHSKYGVMCQVPSLAMISAWKGLCKYFRKRIKDNFCINTVYNPTEPYGLLAGFPTCYVSSECEELGDRGSMVSEYLSIKDCGYTNTNGTRQLKYMDPLELQVIANKNNVTVLNLMKFGYQTIAEWNNATDAMKADARATGIPKMFDRDNITTNTSGTYYVLWGNKTYEVKQQLTQDYVEDRLAKELGVNLNEQYDVRCTSGC